MSAERERVVIAGGGVAALEALLALHELVGHRIEVTLVAPVPEFVYRPVTVAEPFERGEARAYRLDEILAELGGRLVEGSVADVDPVARVIVTESDERIGYDTLILAIGARALDPFPGALTFRGRGDVQAMRAVLDELAD